MRPREALRKNRSAFHTQLCGGLLRFCADDNATNVHILGPRRERITRQVAKKLGASSGLPVEGSIPEMYFEKACEEFIRRSLLASASQSARCFTVARLSDAALEAPGLESYPELKELRCLVRANSELAARIRHCFFYPDILVFRPFVGDKKIGGLHLHASISCKWTIRSDRTQNSRSEALNLIRNRKGHTPHIVVVTAEPLPSRLASICLGTGDIDCVYHFALPELTETVSNLDYLDAADMLKTLVEGRRLRDISDLPLDLAV